MVIPSLPQRILILSSFPSTRVFLRRLLRTNHKDLSIYDTPQLEVALRWHEEKPFDLVMIDQETEESISERMQAFHEASSMTRFLLMTGKPAPRSQRKKAMASPKSSLPSVSKHRLNSTELTSALYRAMISWQPQEELSRSFLNRRQTATTVKRTSPAREILQPTELTAVSVPQAVNRVNKQQISLQTLIFKAEEKVRQVEPKRDWKLHVRPCEAVIDCEAPAVVHLLSELMLNALRFNAEQIAEVTFGAITSKHRTHSAPIFYLKDNGVGMSSRDCTRVFQPNVRLHSQKRFGETKGMGLSKVLRTILRHGGRVWIESRPNQGSTVYFTLQPEDSITRITKEPLSALPPKAG
ncbi:Hypothetical protein PBC10988_16990 [Planctomycetales bacterium 10988]|nr:Hypothetical protein PBC10988_16990 [Planctomycetales bacterium 10988]